MAQDNLKRCPECGLDLPEHLRACVGCGLKTEDLRRCATCESYLGPNWLAFCGWCGSPISTTHHTIPDTPYDPPYNLSHTGRSSTRFSAVSSVASSLQDLEGATNLGSNLIDDERTAETSDVGPDPEDKAQEAFERALGESDPLQKIDCYTEVIRLRPDYPDAFYNRGITYRKIGEHDKAIVDFNEAIRLQPDYPEAFFLRGLGYLQLGELHKAIDDFTEAIRLRPEIPDAFHWRGVSYAWLPESQKAIDDFSEAIRLKPNFPEAFYDRALAYWGIGELHKVIDDFSEAIRLRPDYPDALINRGVRYQELGEFLHAIDDFTEAIRLKPADPDAFRHRGTCFREIGEEQKAIDDFTEANRLGTSNPVERSKQMSTYGAEWTPDQNRIIVEAYFSMLRKQQDEKPYTKSQINREVREQTGKTRGSVEWKFCNISYLLEEMGHPIVNGYKPARNAQRGSLYQEINRHLKIT